MADQTLNEFLARGTTAERLAFTPNPPTPAAGPFHGYTWYDTDDGVLYSWDGAAWQPFGSSPNRSYWRFYEAADSPATWTKPVDPAFLGVRSILIGPSGGSAGSGTNEIIGGASGGGAYSEKWIAAGSLGSTETVTIGAKGAAGAAGNNNGGAASSATSFGAHHSAGAGAPGIEGTSPADAAGGVASGGDLDVDGGFGNQGGTSPAGDGSEDFRGNGGAAGSGITTPQYRLSSIPTSEASGLPWAAAGNVRLGVFEEEGPGFPGRPFGGGASGGWRIDTTDQAGAAGADGRAIVIENYAL